MRSGCIVSGSRRGYRCPSADVAKSGKRIPLVLIPQQAKSPGHVWTVDFVYDTLASGRSIRLLSMVDEFTRKCLAIRAEYGLRSEDVQLTLETLFLDYGHPLYLRSDNGSDEPGSLWQNCPQPLPAGLTNVDDL